MLRQGPRCRSFPPADENPMTKKARMLRSMQNYLRTTQSKDKKTPLNRAKRDRLKKLARRARRVTRLKSQ